MYNFTNITFYNFTNITFDNPNITALKYVCNCNAVYPFCEWYWMALFGVVALANIYLIFLKIQEKRRLLNVR